MNQDSRGKIVFFFLILDSLKVVNGVNKKVTGRGRYKTKT